MRHAMSGASVSARRARPLGATSRRTPRRGSSWNSGAPPAQRVCRMADFAAGDIVIADWRGDALPKEPNKRRPAVVVEDDGLFAPCYPNAILVPLTEDAALAIPDLSVAIAPTAENGCGKPCWAVSHLVATTSKARLRATPSRVTPEQLAAIRRQIALAVGIEG